MRIEKVPEGYLLAREGEGGIEIWRQFNGAESWACAAIDELIAERDALRTKIEAMERQEPYAFAVNFPESSRVELVHDLDEVYEDMIYEAYEVRKLYLAPGAKGE